jgi:hypothetical protein
LFSLPGAVRAILRRRCGGGHAGPAAVRQVIEDELLTESGYRENLAEESLLRRFQAAGAAPDALAKLVNRRLLRIEERLEAHEATERMLAEQRSREEAARRALRRVGRWRPAARSWRRWRSSPRWWHS